MMSTTKDKSFNGIIRSSFWGRYFISLLHCAECRIMPFLISDEKAVKKYYYKSTGKHLNLDNPQTFSEKMNWYKLNGRNPLMQQCADKVGVRGYVRAKGYGDCLNEIYGVYTNVKDIDIDALPDKFVLKAAHGSHMNIIVKDKSAVNWRRAKLMMNTWLHQDIAWSGREWVYKDMPKRIVAERYLEDTCGELRDYKFFCFHSEPTYLQYDIGRYRSESYRNFYDMDCNLISVSDGVAALPKEPLNVTKKQFCEMKKVAEVLSSDFQQVRVDLYVCNNRIYVGEMTFFDGGGSTVFTPDEWNYKFAEKWKVTKI